MATSATVAVPPALDELCINTPRFLAVDMVQKANSGHPGLPMGLAAMAYALWDRSLKYNPREHAEHKPVRSAIGRLQGKDSAYGCANPGH
jgi:hypothetical protein